MSTYREPFTLYEGRIGELRLDAFGSSIDVSDMLESGRANYLLFQKLVGLCAGLDSNSEGGDSDLASPDGLRFEVKAFKDHTAHPATRHDEFHTAASSTFGANNLGPRIKQMLAEDRYDDALSLCKQTGYDKNDFYVYTNTSSFSRSVPFRYVILPKLTVLDLISRTDPRLISRTAVLATVTSTVDLGTLDLSIPSP